MERPADPRDRLTNTQPDLMFFKFALYLAMAALPAACLVGCVTPVSLKQAVEGYNDATTEILASQLLTNIVRVGQRQPAHFTGVTSIAATFNFTVSAGATPALTGDAGSMLLPTFGGSASDNPTFSIVPIEGEDFSKRLLNPMEEGKLTLLLRQYTDIDLLLRLMAGEFRVERNGREESYLNRPSHFGYSKFRQIVLHLSSIQDHNHLFVEPLIFQRDWQLPAESVTSESFRELEKEYSVRFNTETGRFDLTRRVTGRLVITNYDPDLLTNEEKISLNATIEQNAPSEVAVDIRHGYPGGEFPIQGKFRLRSFLNVLSFLGRALNDEPEYDVPRDSRTPPVRENPAFTMELRRSRVPMLDAAVSASTGGEYFALKPDSGYPWNQAAFQLLTVLFQMTVVDLPKFNTPAITIAK
jgi:hypothetical protein